MPYTPETIKSLKKYLIAKTGKEGKYFSIARDYQPSSARGYRGYHLGKDQIFSSVGQKSKDYSIQTARDKAGLSDARSAMDINLPSKKEMALFNYLVTQCRKDAPGTSDIREVIGTSDGKVVLRYDRQRGANSQPKPGEADASHLWHIHISWYRDSEDRDKIGVFEGFFGPRSPSDENAGGVDDEPEAPPAVELPSSEKVVLVNIVEGQRGKIGRGTPILHPTTLKEMFEAGPNPDSRLVGVSPDGKYRGILASTKMIDGPNPKLALVESSKVTDIRNPVDELPALKEQLSTSLSELSVLKERLAANLEDAKNIVARSILEN